MTHPASRLNGRRENPFDSEEARANSQCVTWRDGRLVRVPDADAPIAPVVEFVHDSLRALVLSPRYSCLGAKGALNAGTYRLGVYGEMGSAGATAGLARDLFGFVESRKDATDGYGTFIAAFAGPVASDERTFERHLWAQLRALHALDRAHHAWDPTVSADPHSPGFSFSAAGQAFFVVGLHPAASRYARRFAWPTLVFNPHAQFDRLRQEGKFEGLRDAIRRRDADLQGRLNPMLDDHGRASEARQYAGRAVEDGWRCPFPHAEE